MPGAFEITLKISDSFRNVLKNAKYTLPKYARQLQEESKKHALIQVSKSVFYVYNAYEPKEYVRTYQLLEGVGAESGGRWPHMTVSVYDTAVNRDERWGKIGFKYPGVVEYGQGSSAMDPEDVANRVIGALGKSDNVMPVTFAGRYGWRTMPPRPFMTIALVATGNWFYYKGIKGMLDLWFSQSGTPTTRIIKFNGRR